MGVFWVSVGVCDSGFWCVGWWFSFGGFDCWMVVYFW